MFCLGTNKIELGYSILEDGSVLTVSQVDGLAYGSSDNSRAGHSSGAASPGVDDPDRNVIAKRFQLLSCLGTHSQEMGWNKKLFRPSDLSLHFETFIKRRPTDFEKPYSPAPDSGSTSSGREREIGMTAKKGTIHAERKFNA